MEIESTAEKIIDFWRLLEFFTQDNYPKQNTQKKNDLNKILNAVNLKPYRRISSIEIYHSYRFNNFTEALNEAANIEILFPEISSDVHLFVGKVRRNNVIEKLLELVKGEELIEENKSKICLFSLKMNKDSKYKSGSLCVSPLLWGTAIINCYGTDVTTMKTKLTIEEYKKTIKKIEENKKIFEDNQKVDHVFLRNLSLYIKAFFIDKIFDNLNIEEDITLIYNRFKDKEAYEKLNDSLEDYSDLINSFYQEDLEMVRKSIEQGQTSNRLFLDYICSGHEKFSEIIRQREKYNVRNDNDLIESILCPINAPLGKWPSEYNPAFMQQVAINQYISGEESIFSVNGPPGTGKTTLLKEIIADNVVKRANLLSQYRRADEAFKSVKYLDGDKKNRGYDNYFSVYYSLKDERIKDYGMLVASSNNAAVENITKELPNKENLLNNLKSREVSETRELFDLKKTSDKLMITNEIVNDKGKKEKQTIEVNDIYLSSFAQKLMDQDFDLSQVSDYSEWGLISAALGKRSNISVFFYRVIKPLIKQIKKNNEDSLASYKEARKKFLEQYEHVISLQKQAVNYSNIYNRYLNEKSILIKKTEKIGATIRRLELFIQNDEESINKKRLLIKDRRNQLVELESQKNSLLDVLVQCRAILKQYQSDKQQKESTIKRLEESKKLLEIVSYKIFKKTSKTFLAIENESKDLTSIRENIRNSNYEINKIEKRQCELIKKIKLIGNEIENFKKEIKDKHSKIESYKLTIFDLEKETNLILEEINNLKSRYNEEIIELTKKVEILNPNYFNKMHNGTLKEKVKRQTKIPWITKEYDRSREKLFYDALQLNKYFVLSSNHIRSNLQNLGYMWKILKPRNEDYCNFSDRDRKKAYKHLLNTLFLITPVISTTFASVGRFLINIEDEDSLGQLIIDEAGQSTPQMAIGALWRFKKAIIVGDPKQVEPIVTTEVNAIKKIFRTDELAGYMDKSLSVQTFADNVNPYGAYLKQADQEDLWVGCPLVVHRRCIDPMFSISNHLSYSNSMISQTREPKSESEFIYAKSCWINITGKENGKKDHHVKEQALRAIEIVDKAFEKADGCPDIYIISPFTTVVNGFINLFLKESKYKEEKEWINKNCGTVHKFQGKEAKEVIFLLGCDSNAKGAVRWVNDNIVNVATTRAKYRLYTIGDRQLWRLNPSVSVMQEYLKNFEESSNDFSQEKNSLFNINF
ncbi:DNA helicase [Enterococcus faecalis]|nr:DNA helicase [Enterococcus faecalis]